MELRDTFGESFFHTTIEIDNVWERPSELQKWLPNDHIVDAVGEKLEFKVVHLVFAAEPEWHSCSSRSRHLVPTADGDFASGILAYW